MLEGRHYENRLYGMGYTEWLYKNASITLDDGDTTYQIYWINTSGQRHFWYEPTFEKALAHIDRWEEFIDKSYLNKRK